MQNENLELVIRLLLREAKDTYRDTGDMYSLGVIFGIKKCLAVVNPDWNK